MNRLLLAPFLLCTALATAPAVAGDEDYASGKHPRGEQFCKDHPAKCEEWKARREAFCKDNPETCKQGDAARDKRKAWCDANPAECQKLKDERKARREKMKE